MCVCVCACVRVCVHAMCACVCACNVCMCVRMWNMCGYEGAEVCVGKHFVITHSQ